MALPTSNLSVSLICSTLGVGTPREIFYNGSTLRSLAGLGAIVKKAGLSPSYCPGLSDDERLENLLYYRKLSFFKGYDHNPGYLTASPMVLYFSASPTTGETINISINAGASWAVDYTSASWIIATKQDSATLYVEVETNGVPVSREGTIRITANNGLDLDISVYQDA